MYQQRNNKQPMCLIRKYQVLNAKYTLLGELRNPYKKANIRSSKNKNCVEKIILINISLKNSKDYRNQQNVVKFLR